MSNKELVAQLSERLDWTHIKTSEILAEIVEELHSQLANNSIINVQNFGSFQTRKKTERISVNPQTQQRYLVPPKISVHFKPSSILKEKFK